MLGRIYRGLAEIPDHVSALALILLGAIVSMIHSHEATGQALLASGLALYKGKQ